MSEPNYPIQTYRDFSPRDGKCAGFIKLMETKNERV